ncbi:hypothetical protein E2562_034408 [Oryza meyeriana var. granulata]|uniref:Uncharacterized protein n=1 Tax=Oryza meyeriana var. granulata TaxID=110450 RepID=A0A6G1CKL3_9ORYZ|nr:hypothetical protein E2562_034408 [Oryza meyeriana var. granulata]
MPEREVKASSAKGSRLLGVTKGRSRSGSCTRMAMVGTRSGVSHAVSPLEALGRGSGRRVLWQGRRQPTTRTRFLRRRQRLMT